MATLREKIFFGVDVKMISHNLTNPNNPDTSRTGRELGY